jgi:hypothetical protein
MSDIFADIAGVCMIIAVVILLCVGLESCGNYVSNEKWNNGYCSCGGKWVYDQPIGHQYSTYFLYECDKCGKTEEFTKKR